MVVAYDDYKVLMTETTKTLAMKKTSVVVHKASTRRHTFTIVQHSWEVVSCQSGNACKDGIACELNAVHRMIITFDARDHQSENTRLRCVFQTLKLDAQKELDSYYTL